MSAKHTHFERRWRKGALRVLVLAALVQAASPLLAAAPLWNPPPAAERNGTLPAWTLSAFCAPLGWSPARDAEDEGPAGGPQGFRPGAPWCPLCLLPSFEALLPTAPPPAFVPRLPLRAPQSLAYAEVCPAALHLRLDRARAPPSFQA